MDYRALLDITEFGTILFLPFEDLKTLLIFTLISTGILLIMLTAKIVKFTKGL